MYHPLLDQGIDPNDNGAVYCDECGAEMDWADCDACGGDGEVEMEDDEYEECSICNGDGGWWECTELPHKN
jgi:hypothetical protein